MKKMLVGLVAVFTMFLVAPQQSVEAYWIGDYVDPGTVQIYKDRGGYYFFKEGDKDHFLNKQTHRIDKVRYTRNGFSINNNTIGMPMNELTGLEPVAPRTWSDKTQMYLRKYSYGENEFHVYSNGYDIVVAFVFE